MTRAAAVSFSSGSRPKCRKVCRRWSPSRWRSGPVGWPPGARWCSQLSRGRDARLGHRHLHLQDRDTDPEQQRTIRAVGTGRGPRARPACGCSGSMARRRPEAAAALPARHRRPSCGTKPTGGGAVLGDPTEGAAAEAGPSTSTPGSNCTRPRCRPAGQVPFDHERKLMVTLDV